MDEPDDGELGAFLDETLSADRSAAIEQLLRRDESLRERAARLIQQRDQGGRTLGEIWRRQQLSCPSREELGRHLLRIAEPAESDYIDFHLREIGCRFCAANLADLESTLLPSGEAEARRERYFESSAGLLRSRREE